MLEKFLELEVARENGVLKGIGFNDKVYNLDESTSSLGEENELILEPGDDISIQLTESLGSDVYDNSLSKGLKVKVHDWESGIHISYDFEDYFNKEEDSFRHTVSKHPVTLYISDVEQEDSPVEVLKVVPKA